MSAKNSNTKKRNWAFIIYPDSAPENWFEMLQQSGLPFAVSPLHDKDYNADGTVKKSHYHVILAYPGPTTYNAVKTLVDTFNSPIPQPLESVKGYYRYLCHLDNPEKAQYSDSDIRVGGGFNYRDYCDLTTSEVVSLRKQIQSLIREYDIYEYCDLLDILLDNDMSDMYDVASTNTLLFQNYITSRRNKRMLKQTLDCCADNCVCSETVDGSEASASADVPNGNRSNNNNILQQ